MQFTINSQVLLSLAQRASVICPSKSMLPIIENLLISVNGADKKITITATNLEDSIVISSDILSCNFDTTQHVAIAPKITEDLLKSLPRQELTIIFTDNNGVKLQTETGLYSISGEAADNFPPVADFEALDSFELQKKTFMRGYEKVGFAISTDPDRMALNCMYVRLSKGEITFVGTDAHKLVAFAVDFETEKELNFLLRQKACDFIKKSLNANDTIKISLSENNIVFESENSKIIIRALQEKYPKWENVIPQNNDKRVSIAKEDLLRSIKRTGFFANKVSNLIQLNIGENKMDIQSEDLDFATEAKEILRCVSDSEIAIGMNAVNMAACLNIIDTDIVNIELGEPNRAVLLKNEKDILGETLTVLVMPIMLTN